MSVLMPSPLPPHPPRNGFIHYVAHAVMGFLLFFKEAWAGVEYSVSVPLHERKENSLLGCFPAVPAAVCRREWRGSAAARNARRGGSEASRLPFASKLCWLPGVRLASEFQHETKRCCAGMTRYADGFVGRCSERLFGIGSLREEQR